MHAITHKKAQVAPNVIVATIFIFKKIAYVLFDTDASYSFIFATYVKLFKLIVEVLEEPIYVATLVESFFVTN